MPDSEDPKGRACQGPGVIFRAPMKTITSYKNLAEEELARLAHILAPLLKAGDVIGLKGPLGAGKSVFARSLVKTLMGQEKLDVPSPTYTLVHPYQPPAPSPEILHIDLYRVENQNELRELGLDDASNAVLVIEWPEKMGKQFISEALLIEISRGKTRKHRNVVFKGPVAWKKRLAHQTLIRA